MITELFVPALHGIEQSSEMSFFSLLISAHEILNVSEFTVLKFNYDPFVFTAMLIYKYEYNEYEYKIDIELITFEICLILKRTHLDS